MHRQCEANTNVDEPFAPVSREVEASFKLSIRHLGKRLFYCDIAEFEKWNVDRSQPLYGKNGSFFLIREFGTIEFVQAKHQVFFEPYELLISFPTKLGGLFQQTIPLDTYKLNHGIGTLFRCSCGKRTSTLYLRDAKLTERFACRNCLNLRYASQSKGSLLMNLHKQLRVADTLSGIQRFFYRGKQTKKFKSFLRLSKKWHLRPESAKNLKRKLDSRNKHKPLYLRRSEAIRQYFGFSAEPRPQDISSTCAYS